MGHTAKSFLFYLMILINITVSGFGQDEIDSLFEGGEFRNRDEIIYLEGYLSRNPRLGISYERLLYWKKLSLTHGITIGADILLPNCEYNSVSKLFYEGGVDYRPQIPISPFIEWKWYMIGIPYNTEWVFSGLRYQFWDTRGCFFHDLSMFLGCNYPLKKTYSLQFNLGLGLRLLKYRPIDRPFDANDDLELAPVVNLLIGVGRII
jgi:hypothetical protein